MTYKKSEIDGKPRIHEVYESEDCDGCKKLTREEERIKTKDRFLIEMKNIIHEAFTQHEYKEVKKLRIKLNIIFIYLVILSGFVVFMWIKLRESIYLLNQHISK